MSAILGDLPYVRVYIDDIIVFSDSLEDHEKHLHEVLTRLNKYNLRIQPPKCKFFMPEVPYLGHIVSCTGIRIAGTRVADIASIPQPASGKQIQAFFGMANFLRAFIPNLATLAAPLDVLRNVKYIDLDDPAVWTHKC